MPALKGLSKLRTLLLPFVASNFHCHWRQDLMADWMVDMLIESGFLGYVLGMPNTKPNPLMTGMQSVRYVETDIMPALRRHPEKNRFTPIPTIQLTRDTTPNMIKNAQACGIRAVKIYPRYVTTHSEHGIENYQEQVFPLLPHVYEANMVSCWHAEHPSFDVIGRLKEKKFKPILQEVRRFYPKLRIMVEHASDKEMIDWVLGEDPQYVRMTLTPHHMLFTADELQGYSRRSKGLMQIHHGYKPQSKDPEDRKAVEDAMFSGDPRVVYGGDDAAHFEDDKHAGACGSFNTPAALPVLVQRAVERDQVNQLTPLLAHNGPDFYGLPRNTGQIELRRESWTTPEHFAFGQAELKPLRAGEVLPWRLV